MELSVSLGYLIVLILNTALDWGVALERWAPNYLAFFGIWIGF
jgi:hypothetical protein